jgi:hypothetical protein
MANGSLAVPSAMSTSPSSSFTSSRSSTDISGVDQGQSSSSSRGSPEVSSHGSSPTPSGFTSSSSDGPSMNVDIGVSAGVLSAPRGPARSGISDGLRAAAAAAATPQAETESVTNPFSSLSRPPSYGRSSAAQPTLSTVPPPPQDELPKYEDVMDYGGNNNIGSSRTESGLGITIPRSSPMPMPMRVPCRGSHSTSPQATFSPQSIGMSHSPLQQQIHRNSSGRFLASPPSSSPISPPTEGALSVGRDGQRSSPQAIRGHARTGSTTSMLHSTSLARSQQSSSGFLSMTPTTAASATTQLQYSFPTQSPIQRQASIGQQQRHQRQRSIGAATIMGSLGRNGGYLSQQPAPLTMSSFDCMSAASSSILVSNAGRATSPPAYVE